MKLVVGLSLAAFLVGQSAFLRADEKVLVSYTSSFFSVDLNGDGVKDKGTIACNKVLDSSYNSSTHTESTEKETWYHFKLSVIDGASGKKLLEDEFSMNEGDFGGLFEHFGKPSLSPQKYVDAFFDAGKTGNEIEFSALDENSVDDDWTKKRIKATKAKTTVAKVRKELLSGKHAILVYRGSWAEDLRQVVYSNQMGAATGLKSPYGE